MIFKRSFQYKSFNVTFLKTMVWIQVCITRNNILVAIPWESSYSTETTWFIDILETPFASSGSGTSCPQRNPGNKIQLLQSIFWQVQTYFARQKVFVDHFWASANVSPRESHHDRDKCSKHPKLVVHLVATLDNGRRWLVDGRSSKKSAIKTKKTKKWWSENQ